MRCMRRTGERRRPCEGAGLQQARVSSRAVTGTAVRGLSGRDLGAGEVVEEREREDWAGVGGLSNEETGSVSLGD
jgi:hypothetical protein